MGTQKIRLNDMKPQCNQVLQTYTHFQTMLKCVNRKCLRYIPQCYDTHHKRNKTLTAIQENTKSKAISSNCLSEMIAELEQTVSVLLNKSQTHTQTHTHKQTHTHTHTHTHFKRHIYNK